MRQLRANLAARFRGAIIIGGKRPTPFGRSWILTVIADLTAVVVIVILIVTVAATAAVTSLLLTMLLLPLFYLLPLLLP
jgi:hypothetical protein